MDNSVLDQTYESEQQEFICVICKRLAINPSWCKICEHLFCKECIEQWLRNKPTCPACRRWYEPSDSRILRSLFLGSQIPCMYKLNGCNTKLTLERMSVHQNDCDFKVVDESQEVNCLYCVERINKLHQHLHYNQCTRKLIKCEYCGVQAAQDYLSVHQLTDKKCGDQQKLLKLITREKIVISLLGESNVGKTTFLYRYIQGVFVQTTSSVIPDTITKKYPIAHNRTINVQFWDTPGNKKYLQVTKNHLQNKDAIIMFYDITDRQSFKQIETYWLRQYREFASEFTKVFLLGCKQDDYHKRQVQYCEGKQLMIKHKFQYFEEISSLENINIIEAVNKIIRMTYYNEMQYEQYDNYIKLQRRERIEETREEMNCQC